MSLRRLRTLAIVLTLGLGALLAAAPLAARQVRPAPGKVAVRPDPAGQGLISWLVQHLRSLLTKSGPGVDPNGHH